MNIFCLGLSIFTILNTDYKVEARVFSDVFGKLLFAGALFIIILFRGKKIYNKEYWKYALKFNIPLIPHYLSNYILNQSDRLMIGKMVDNHPEKTKNKINPFVILIAVLSIITMAFAPEVISIFAGKEYMDAIYVIPPITASVYFIFVYYMFSTIEYYYEKTGFIAVATTISAILN